ncbi:MAG: hypothetical protein APF76_03255 [Desulfitibacter sp. BRH_c19]|nr:MAG: hypothetical protein APF76_03255 [Desulfitibacter sp. BRH_c19]
MQEKISKGQFSKLVTLIIISTVFLTLPRRLALVAQWDSPISLVLGYGAAWFLGVIVIWLSLKHPNDTFIEYSKKILGPYLGSLFGIMVFLVIMNLNILTIRLAGATYIAAGYTQTPIIVFAGATVLLSVWILKEGIEVLARVAEFFYFPLILSIAILPLTVIDKLSLDNLFPLLAFGLEPVLSGAMLAFSIGIEHVFLVGLLISKIQNLDKKVYHQHLYGVVIGAFIILLMVASTIGVFGVADIQRFYLPPYQLAKVVEIGAFINGIEIILLGIWTIASLLEVTIFLYISVHILSQLIYVSYRDIIVPLAYLFLSMAMAPMDNHQVESEFTIVGQFGILPVALLLVAFLVPAQLFYQWKTKQKLGGDSNKEAK